MRSVQFRVEENNGIKYTLKISLGGDFTKEEVLSNKGELVSYIKKEHPRAKTIDILIPTKQTRFTKKQLEEVGINAASSWGAEYLGHKCYENFVEFGAVEYGERFSFLLTYDEIAKDLNK